MSVEENIKKSKRNYGDKYNKENINVQLNRELIDRLKLEIKNKKSIKSYIEELINEKLNAH
jgi:hypothetical protein